MNSKSQTAIDDGSALPSAKLSRGQSIKSQKTLRNTKETNEEIGAVIDFMALKKSKIKDGARTP